MKNAILVFVSLITAFACSACRKESDAMGSAIVRVRLTDAPGDYEAVHVDIQGIEIKTTDGADEGGWVALKNVHTGVYNLLELTNGLDTLIGSDNLPVGMLAQIRLKLGDENSVKINGEWHELQTPSAQQSGLKLPIHTTLKEGIAYTVLLDFDAARSIVSAGNSGKYLLKPVIRTVTEAQSGALRGRVAPATVPAAVYAITGTDTVGTYTNADGYFLVRGLSAATYRVIIQPNGYATKTIENVLVSLDNVANIGEVNVVEE